MNRSNSAEISGIGYVYVLIAAVLWALAAALSKFLFNNGISAFQLVQLRITISAVTLCVWLAVCNPSLLKISRKDIVYFFILGALGMAVMQSAYMYAVSKIHVAVAILLQYLSPILVALYSAVIGREKPRLSTIIAITGTTTGCWLAAGVYNFDLLQLNFQGIAAGLLSAVGFAWYTVQSEYGMRRYDPSTVLVYAMLFGALSWNILHPPLESFQHSYTAGIWGVILFIGIPGSLIPFLLYFRGIRLIRSTRANITATFEPICAGIISYLFLKEIMEPLQLLGGAMVISAIILLQLTHRSERRRSYESGPDRSCAVDSGDGQ